jgi:hypothetical protein
LLEGKGKNSIENAQIRDIEAFRKAIYDFVKS